MDSCNAYLVTTNNNKFIYLPRGNSIVGDAVRIEGRCRIEFAEDSVIEKCIIEHNIVEESIANITEKEMNDASKSFLEQLLAIKNERNYEETSLNKEIIEIIKEENKLYKMKIYYAKSVYDIAETLNVEKRRDTTRQRNGYFKGFKQPRIDD